MCVIDLLVQSSPDKMPPVRENDKREVKAKIAGGMRRERENDTTAVEQTTEQHNKEAEYLKKNKSGSPSKSIDSVMKGRIEEYK